MSIMRTSDTPELRRLILTKARCIHNLGPDHPDTIEAARQLIYARIDAAEAGIAELRRELAGLPDVVAA